MGPIIGILTRSGVNEKGTPVEYCMESTRRAIIKAGGVPIMLTPPQDIDYFTTKNSEFPDLTGMEKEMILYQIEKLDAYLFLVEIRLLSMIIMYLKNVLKEIFQFLEYVWVCS